MILSVFHSRVRSSATLLTLLTTAFVLAACSGGSGLSSGPTPEPGDSPTSTPNSFVDFATANITPADPERLTNLTSLLSLVPQEYDSAVYLDSGILRSNVLLTRSVDAQALGLSSALPSLATELVNSVAISSDSEALRIITPFEGDFRISDMIQLAGGFGLEMGQSGPESYNNHPIYEVSILGNVSALATADFTTGTGVAAIHRRGTAEETVKLAKGALDAFDGRADQLLDLPGLADLVGNIPSGFVTAVLSQCEDIPLISDGDGLPGCSGLVPSSTVTSGDLVVFQVLVGFEGQQHAKSALQRANDSLADQREKYGFEDLAVGLEGTT